MLKRTTNEIATAPVETIAQRQTALEKKKKGITLTSVFLILLILSIVGFAWAFVNYQNYRSKLARISTPDGQQELVRGQTADLVNKVKRLIVLPADEEPTIATVLDADGLAKDQPFYKDAQNGDKVLIYVKAQKAIVYSEAKDILVNVGPVFIDNRNQNFPASAPPTSVRPSLGDNSEPSD